MTIRHCNMIRPHSSKRQPGAGARPAALWLASWTAPSKHHTVSDCQQHVANPRVLLDPAREIPDPDRALVLGGHVERRSIAE